MRRKITDLTEGDIAPPTQPEAAEPEQAQSEEKTPPEPAVPGVFSTSPNDPGTALMNVFVPTDGRPLVRPEDDRVIYHVGGSPVLASEAAEFGRKFIGLLAFLTKVTGLDNSPEPEGKTPNYLRVRCTKCQAVIVTIAPQVEKFCSVCGAVLPTPTRTAAAPRAVPTDNIDRENAVDAEYTVAEEGSNGRE